jgi:hypothetical protein
MYKIACGVLLLGVIFLGTRLKISEDHAQTLIEDLSEKSSSVSDLEDKNEILTQQVDYLLSENGMLVNASNEMKTQINTKPLIIYRNEKNIRVNSSASEQYIDLLSNRYEFE